jgi:hypothetical protein
MEFLKSFLRQQGVQQAMQGFEQQNRKHTASKQIKQLGLANPAIGWVGLDWGLGQDPWVWVKGNGSCIKTKISSFCN